MRHATELSSPFPPGNDQTFSVGDNDRLIPVSNEKEHEELLKALDKQTEGQGGTRSKDLISEFRVIADVVYPNEDQGSEDILGVIAKIDRGAAASDHEKSPVGDRTRGEAKEILLRLWHQHGLRITEACTMENGGIELEASSRYWELGIWVEPTGVVSFVISGPEIERTSSQGNLQEIISRVWEKIVG